MCFHHHCSSPGSHGMFHRLKWIYFVIFTVALPGCTVLSTYTAYQFKFMEAIASIVWIGSYTPPEVKYQLYTCRSSYILFKTRHSCSSKYARRECCAVAQSVGRELSGHKNPVFRCLLYQVTCCVGKGIPWDLNNANTSIHYKFNKCRYLLRCVWIWLSPWNSVPWKVNFFSDIKTISPTCNYMHIGRIKI